MMKRKLTACLFILAIWVLFPVTAWAQETTITTQIPSNHTLHIDIAGNGEVLVDGVSCKQTGDLQIQRGTTPQITVKSAGGAVLKTAVLNEEDITEELSTATYLMPEMYFDAALTVVFESVSDVPQTGDPAPVKGLIFAMLLSVTGVLCCLLLPRKERR